VSPRTAAAAAFVVLAVALLAVVAIGTPWRTAPPTPGGGAKPAVSGDFTPEQIGREKAFHRALRPWSLTGMAVALAVTIALGLTPLGAKIVELVARPFGGGWVWEAVLGGLALGLIGQLVTLPFSVRSESVRRRYGLSTQDWGGWLVDLAKGLALGAVLGAAALLIFYAVVRAAPHWWWAWIAGGAAAMVFVLAFAFPVLVEPIFNKFTPMPDTPVRSELLTMAAADGVPVRDVLVADASRRTTAFNAYVSGYGATRRIVVYDTLLNSAPPEEVKLVVAHELGHAKRNDVLFGTTIGALGAATAVCGLYLLLGWKPLLSRAGVDDIGDPRSIALLFAIAAIAGFLAAPAQNLLSRKIEARADEHALDLTRDPAGFVDMQRRLAVRNLADLEPNPLLYLWLSSHPSTPERIAQARDFAGREHLPVAGPGR
jgi:STE24 endopeptidase